MVIQSVSVSICLSVCQSINQSIRQSVNQSINQSVSQSFSLSLSVNQLINLISKPNDRSFDQYENIVDVFSSVSHLSDHLLELAQSPQRLLLMNVMSVNFLSKLSHRLNFIDSSSLYAHMFDRGWTGWLTIRLTIRRLPLVK